MGASQREQRRKVQKKTGEQYLDSEFNNKLKGTSQWYKWKEELDLTLSQIIGVQGVPLSYVIREDEARNFVNNVEYETAVIQGTGILQQGRVRHREHFLREVSSSGSEMPRAKWMGGSVNGEETNAKKGKELFGGLVFF